MFAKKKYLALIFVLGTILLTSCSRANQNCQHAFDERDWALDNHAQVINDNRGKKDIDIGIKDILEEIRDYSPVNVVVIDTGAEGYNGRDFYNGDNSIFDSYYYDYHGTYICNIIAKVSPNAQIICNKFMEGTNGNIDKAYDAMKDAVDNGADIINCSWCSNEYSKKIDTLIKNNPNVLFVCSAGNSLINLDEYNVYPASYKYNNVISVIAIDNKGDLYQFSGYGKSATLAAPGKDILVNLPDGDLGFIDGTSASAAFVSSAASIIKGKYPDLSAEEIKKALVENVVELDTIKGKCESNGVINIQRALEGAEKIIENKN